MSVTDWWLLGLAMLAGSVVTVAVIAWRGAPGFAGSWHRRRVVTGDVAPPVTPERHSPQVAFVVNSTKPGVVALHKAALRGCATRGMPEPIWLETTAGDAGRGQAREALHRGADVVVAVGGDGTLRAVADAMTGSGLPMGIIPMGTGNLFARNVDIPLNDPEGALRVALSGRDRVVDVGWLEVQRAGGLVDASEHLFLVIAGLGFDAKMVGDTDENLKKRVGWIAYFLGAIRHLHGPRPRVTVEVDDQISRQMPVQTLLIGNCGKLPGGITLLPDAVVDDGWLDVAALDTRGGMIGWSQLFGEVVLQGFGVRSTLPAGVARAGRLDHVRGRDVVVRTDHPVEIQVDGEVLGKARQIRARIDPGALIVRVPATGEAQT